METIKVITGLERFRWDEKEKFNMEIHDDITPAYEYGDNDLIFIDGIPKTKEMIDTVKNFFEERIKYNEENNIDDELHSETAKDLIKHLDEKYPDCNYYVPCNGIATLEDYNGMIAVELNSGNSIEVYEFDESVCFVMAYHSCRWNKLYETVFDGIVEEISLSEQSVNLDEFSNNDIKTQTVGLHEKVHLGKNEDDEIAYYVKRTTQWCGEFDYLAKFGTKEEVLEYIENLTDYDRNIEEYKYDIEQLQLV